MNQSRIIIALDLDEVATIEALLEQIPPSRCRLKMGLQLFVRFGPSFVSSLVSRGYDIFLDLKFHDIPNTVANACRAAADLGVWMINVHALGGSKMMEAARVAVDKASHQPLLIAVTVLTSMQQSDVDALGLTAPILNTTEQLALLTKSAGLDGVVCSPHEASRIREVAGANFKIVTPGIRMPGDKADDQARIMTPDMAMQAGVDYMVIGRSITNAADPMAVIAQIEKLL